MKKLACGLGLVALAACGAPEDDPELMEPDVESGRAAAIEAELAAFAADPQRFLNTIPRKEGDSPAFFSPEAIASGDFLKGKDSTRQDPDPKADAWQPHDWAKNLVDSYELTRLGDMYQLKKASLAESPWSDDYWPLYAGSLAKRYADPRLPSGTDWKKITDYVRTTPPQNPDHLSPAEKYDLLVGDAAKTMTNYNINTGKPYYDRDGKVETWMGQCHGWAPAAFMIPRPKKVVEVTAADGTTKIKFYPADIKALATLLWATARAPTRFIGGRCNVKDPAKDEIGRIKDAACRDTNAGTWHLAIVNQLGRGKRSFILDATYDYEVWNQPIYSYDYVYFNPKTNVTTNYLSRARVAVSDFPEDKFAKYRARGTTHIVGIAMNVKWVVETRPTQSPTDGPERDALSGARYLYTLELDKDGNIIGGEWLQNAHPDFLWVPPKEAQARAYYEPTSGTWDGRSPMPQSWREAARRSSQHGQPLAAIVNKLVELARQ
ncbi:MAG: hypothetical protein RMK29_13350 [Myxococcales bacterium]|nr:hypothetical protein [Myxococcota bacterium]MDW8282693.1 hypothetical protein [Myxococcales bacterium]